MLIDASGSALGREENEEFVQLAVGYSLTGVTWEEILFYLFGPTRSGKGTFIETIIALLGLPLAFEADFTTFTSERNGDTQNFDLAPLRPCRFVAAGESNKNQPLNPAKLKQLTGRNWISCAFKHKTQFGYQPKFKIWLSSNHPVNVDVDDDAAWARVRVIEFPHSHLGTEDKMLKERLSTPEALEGLLAWAVEGARKYYQNRTAGIGLPYPEAVRKTTEDQRDNSDFVKAFMNECLVKSVDGYLTNATAYQHYKTWCENNGVTPKHLKQFSEAMSRKGFPTKLKKVEGKVIRIFDGLQLSQPPSI
jgi:putative DNA primase/helicase